LAVSIPREIDWTRVSPESREVATHVVFRLTAGFTLDEVATMLQANPPAFRQLGVPAKGISKHWLSARMRDLRAEIRENEEAT
jgi:hypothetical protein